MGRWNGGTHWAGDIVNVRPSEEDVCDDVYDLEQRVDVVNVSDGVTVAMRRPTLRTIPSCHESFAIVFYLFQTRSMTGMVQSEVTG